MALPPWKLQVILISITPTTIRAIIPEETLPRKLKANLDFYKILRKLQLKIMTIAKAIDIEGCGHERPATWTFVDLSEPEKIGQHPTRGKRQICPETLLRRDVRLKVKVTGQTQVDKEFNTTHAEVLISCPATDCPYHKKYNKTTA